MRSVKWLYLILIFVFAAAIIGNAQPLVSVKWLHDNLNAPNVVVLDVSSAKVYAQGHIPGAIRADFKKIEVKRNGLVAELPDKAALQQYLRDLGISNNSHVIVVWPDTKLKMVYYATRTYFTLKNFGVNVSVLDGGLKAWKANGYKVSTEVPTITKKGNITLKDFNKAALATLEDVKKAKYLVDDRPADFYLGKKKHKVVAKPGTIKGAINIPFTMYFNADWTFKSADAIKTLAKEKGVGTPAIHFCNSGNIASIGWFAFNEIAKLPARLYDGSMNEWASCADCAIACAACK